MARIREGASRVCWLKSRILGGCEGVEEGGERKEGDGEDEEEANHSAAKVTLSIVCPESICHAIPFSRRISHLPGQCTFSRPWMNSSGRLDEAGREGTLGRVRR